MKETNHTSYPRQKKRYGKVKAKSQESVRINRLRSDLDEGVENPSARTRK